MSEVPGFPKGDRLIDSGGPSRIDGGAGGGDNGQMEARVNAVEKAIIRIEAVLPTLATKGDVEKVLADMHKEMNAQTWRFVTYVTLAGGALTAAVYFIASHVR